MTPAELRRLEVEVIKANPGVLAGDVITAHREAWLVGHLVTHQEGQP
jgi:hypothetical protein